MLNGIHLVNFGNHRDTKVYFGKITALVGANGTGKTTVMRGVQWLKREELANDKDLTRHGQPHAALTASWPGWINPESVDAGIVNSRGTERWLRKKRGDDVAPWLPKPDAEELWNTAAGALIDDRDWDSALPGSITAVRHWSNLRDEFPIWSARYFKTGGAWLRRPAIAEGDVPVLSDSGTNLAAVLTYLMTAEPERFAHITAALRSVVPTFRRVRSRPVSIEESVKQTITVNKQDRIFEETREVAGHALVFDMTSGQGLPASRVSEGTLVTLAILTLVFGMDEADMIMLDDVELGLHPRAQRDLIRQLKKIQELKPDLQILVSTHSPYIVDELAAEDVWLFTTDEEGCAVTKRLSEHPDAERALEVLTTGEFWSSQGEEWVADEARAERESAAAPESVVAEDEAK